MTDDTVPASHKHVLVAMLAATTILSQFFRTSLAVIAPELIQDLSLSPQMLGVANGAFFLALLAAQVAVGVAFDRIGVRITTAAVSVFMVAGALVHAMAASGEMLVAARALLGLGCAASFMATLVLISRWYPRARWAMALGWVFSLSQLGNLAAGTPLALAAEAVGWRTAFVAMAAIAALVGVLFFALVRDGPDEAATPVAKAPAQPHPGALEGLRLILGQPGILPVFALFSVAYAAAVTVTGLWAGPYLKDIHGLDATARGHVLTAMALVQMLAVLAFGALDRVFNTRKWIVVAGALATIAVLAALATHPVPPFWIAIGLLLGLSAATCYNPVLLAHMRGHIPDHLAGRGATTGNIAQLIGSAGLPMLTGMIPPLFPPVGGGYAPDAYRWIFGTLALALGLGLAVYLRSKDIRPRAA